MTTWPAAPAAPAARADPLLGARHQPADPGPPIAARITESALCLVAALPLQPAVTGIPAPAPRRHLGRVCATMGLGPAAAMAPPPPPTAQSLVWRGPAAARQIESTGRHGV